ncbi:hypothetical protein [Silvanigrella aquatica]|uniref:Uncharacterized protein n=1 Tax=Silvanigrella aquatica TaxID=1915309 RepID=A0A1L4D227_9BACT|nr:hypothetical protein [Silvanigrella aquatica]APJ04247.1 hypothetical protein AXG55_10145 [Silvanigrella aquatica]
MKIVISILSMFFATSVFANNQNLNIEISSIENNGQEDSHNNRRSKRCATRSPVSGNCIPKQIYEIEAACIATLNNPAGASPEGVGLCTSIILGCWNHPSVCRYQVWWG